MSRRHFVNSSEVLEASLHPGGLLRGIQARRFFSQSANVTRLQSAARRYLAQQRFWVLRAEAFPRVRQQLQDRVTTLVTELRGLEKECDGLNRRGAGMEQRVQEWTEWTKEKEESITKLEQELKGETVGKGRFDEEVRALEGLRLRLREQLGKIVEGESKIETLRTQVDLNVEKFSPPWIQSADNQLETYRILKESRDRLELFLEAQETGFASSRFSSPIRRSPPTESSTFVKLDRTTRSPFAPPELLEKPKFTIPKSNFRPSQGGSPFSRVRPMSLLPPSTGNSPSESSASKRYRFSTPPPSRPQIISIPRPEQFVMPDPAKVQKSLLAFYSIPTSTQDTISTPTQRHSILPSSSESLASTTETAEAELPNYVLDLLSSLSSDPLKIEGPGALRLNALSDSGNIRSVRERLQRPRQGSSGTFKTVDTTKTSRSALGKAWLKGIKEKVLG